MWWQGLPVSGGVFWGSADRVRAGWRWLILAIVSASVVVWSVTGSELPASAVAPAKKPAAAAAKPVAKVGSRPDVTSAAVSARAQGSPVEVEDLRSEFTSTFANPDGSLTLKASTGEQRYRDASGAWRPISLEVDESDGRLVAEKTRGRVVLAGEGKSASGSAKSASDGAARSATSGASAGADGADLVGAELGTPRQVLLGWSKALGKPTVSGSSVSYPGSAGVGVRVRLTRSGYETFFVVKDAAAVKAAVASSGPAKGRVAFEVPVKTKGLSARSEKDGSVSFVDGKGKVVSRLVAPQAWDAKIDKASGLPSATTPVRMDVASRGKDKAVVTVSIDAGWATASERVFPLTVDPTYAPVTLKPSFDTRVQTDQGSLDYSKDSELRVGTYNGGAVKARSYLMFPVTSIQYKQIQSASLSLYTNFSSSCSARGMNVMRARQSDTSTRWDNQPVTTGVVGTASFAKGYNSSCPAGRQSINMTDLAKVWASEGWGTGSIGLQAVSETDSYGWKRFASAETANPPMLQVTYNRPPAAPAKPTFIATGTFASVGYVQGARVTFSAVATDPDASRVKQVIEVHSSTSGSSKLGECTTGLVASGQTVSCAPPADLPNGASSYVRAKAVDELGLSGPWSGWTTIRRAGTAPAAPSIACPGYANGTWTDAAPSGNVTCTIATNQTGTFAPVTVQVFTDGGSTPAKTVAANQAASSTTVTFNKSPDGAHEIRAVAIGAAKLSSSATHVFGWGGASLLTPQAKSTTSGNVTVSAQGPPKGAAPSVTGTVQWRVAGHTSDGAGWANATDAPVVISTGPGGVTKATAVWDTQSADTDAAGVPVPDRTPVLLDVQICLSYGSLRQCTWSQSATSITREPHAFGDGYPTADAGPGQVAQYTGELSLPATDASVPGLASDMSIGRSHLSFGGDGTLAGWPSADPAAKVYGPGFTSTWTGPDDAGTGNLNVVDNTGVDGTLVLIDEDGHPLVYRQPSKGRTPRQAGTYTAATDDTVDAAMKLVVTGSGAATRIVVTDEDGTATTYAPTAMPTDKPWQWGVEKIAEPGAAGTTTYTRDSAGRVVRILSGLPDGYTAASCPATGIMQPGCRAMTITYGTTNTGGDRIDQVKSVSAVLWDPATSGMKTTPVATYTYDSSGRLTKVTDPRSSLSTSYTWDGSSTRIASLTPPGQAPFRFAYETGGSKGARLKQVTRDAANTGGQAVPIASYVYDLAPTAAGGPGLSAAKVGTWFQAKAPTAGFAVFGADHPVSSATSITAADYPYADLSYVDGQGYEVNTASFGAGQWLLTASDYDGQGNTVREFGADDITAVTAAAPDTKDGADAYSTQSIYNADGTLLLESVDPTRQLTLPNGDQVTSRVRTTTTYDQGAPNGGTNPATGTKYNLPTTVTQTVDGTATGNGDDIQLTSTTSGYAPVESGDKSGWDLGAATSTTTGGITRTTRYDATGRTIEVRQPSATGTNHVGTTRTIFYTAGANSADAACGNTTTAKAFAGLVCRTLNGAAPSSGPAIPDSRTTGYNMWGSPTTVVETSGSATRTTATTYDGAGRPKLGKTTSTIPGSTPVEAKFTTYDPATGLVTATGVANAAGQETSNRITTTYDKWGRVETYKNAAGDTGTTAYDNAGRVASFADNKGTTTYAYDGTDAAGKTERRGLATKATITRAGGDDLVFTGAYDQAGALIRQDLPGQVTATSVRNELGQEIGVSYTGQVTPVTATTDPDTGDTTWTPGTPTRDDWVGWTVERDGMGRVAREYTSTGALFNPDPNVTTPDDGDETTAPVAPAAAQATAYDRAYTYDGAGRLTKVNDRIGVLGGGGINPDTTTGGIATCQVRSYGYTGDAGKNGARTTTSYATHTDGDCAGTDNTTTTTRTQTYDTADRPTTAAKVNDTQQPGSYVYDAFGRQTTLPAGDAPNPTGGNVTLGYFDTDVPAKVTQGGNTTTFVLDAADRRLGQRVENATEMVNTTTRHYTDASDNPSWVQVTPIGSTTPQVTRFVDGLSSELGAQIRGDGLAQITITDPGGNAVSAIEIPATQNTGDPATGLAGWDTYTEYGATAGGTSPTPAVAGPVGYGWLGGAQRSTTPDTAGLTLMGVRYYNNTTGLFTGPDPILGGNDTSYGYPSDPINSQDTTGMWWGEKRLKRIGAWVDHHRNEVVRYAGYAAIGICVVATSGVCLGAALTAASISTANRYVSYRRHEISGKQFFFRSFVDFGFAALPGFRAKRYYKHLRFSRWNRKRQWGVHTTWHNSSRSYLGRRAGLAAAAALWTKWS